MKLSYFLVLLFLFSCTQDTTLKSEKSKSDISNQMDVEFDNSEIELLKSDTLCDESFDQFFLRFKNDSTFQKIRIIFPLEIEYYEDPTIDSLSKEIIKKQDYRFNECYKGGMHYESSRFYIEDYAENDSIHIVVERGDDNGILVFNKFKKIECRWKLIEIQNNST